MTVPVLITDLSTTALDNAPSGEDAPSTLDNIQRAHAAFIAKLRDESASLTGAQTLTNKTLTSPVISGGTINNAAIGGTTPAAASFTTLAASGAATFPAGATVTGAALLGYGAGSGGTVTQATSKVTAVTLNKPSGFITMDAAALAAGASVVFTLNNSLLSSTDNLIVRYQHAAASLNYNVWIALAGSGQAWIGVKNISAGSLSEALPIKFEVIKGATS